MLDDLAWLGVSYHTIVPNERDDFFCKVQKIERNDSSRGYLLKRSWKTARSAAPHPSPQALPISRISRRRITGWFSFIRNDSALVKRQRICNVLKRRCAAAKYAPSGTAVAPLHST